MTIKSIYAWTKYDFKRKLFTKRLIQLKVLSKQFELSLTLFSYTGYLFITKVMTGQNMTQVSDFIREM